MGIAQNNLGSHVNEFIDKEQSAFKHFLMNEHTPAGLSGDHQNNAEQIGGKPGPWGIGNCQYRTVDIALNLIAVGMGRND